MNYLDRREPPRYYLMEENTEYQIENLLIVEKRWGFPTRYYAAIIFLLAVTCIL